VFYVYVLHSVTDRGFYIGYSADLKRRLSEHKQGASFATKHRGPWKLIYYEAYAEQLDAKGRESVSQERWWSAFSAASVDLLPRKVSKFINRVRRKPFTRATPLGFEPRITPPKGAVLPLHHGVFRIEALDWPFCIEAQITKRPTTEF
jgi:putative endonuclease